MNANPESFPAGIRERFGASAEPQGHGARAMAMCHSHSITVPPKLLSQFSTIT